MTIKEKIKSNWDLYAIIVVFIYVVGIFINVNGFWHDEIHTLAFIRGIGIYPFEGSDFSFFTNYESVGWFKNLLEIDDFYENFHRNIIHEGHPPLYYLLLKIWTNIFGFNEFGLRSFSLFTSALSIFIFSLIIKFIIGKQKNIYTLLLAVAPFFIYYSCEARSYSLYFLFALITTYYFLKELLNPIKGLKNNILFSFFTVLLIYTHYYGVFIYSILGILLTVTYLKNKLYFRIPLLLAPITLFTPWFYIIQQQTKAHSNHWTDGMLTISESIIAFLNNTFKLLTSPTGSINRIEIIVLSIAFIVLFINFVFGKKFVLKNVLICVFIFVFYGIQIITFDIFLDHHTIAIPRYYFPLIFFVLLMIIYCIEYGKYKLINYLILIMIVSSSLVHSYYVINSTTTNKQMYIDAAGYIDQNYNANEFKLISCPHGPTTLGIAYYLKQDFKIKGIDIEELCEEYNTEKTIFIEQKLGVNTEPWNLDCSEKHTPLKKINFVGLDLVEKK